MTKIDLLVQLGKDLAQVRKRADDADIAQAAAKRAGDLEVSMKQGRLSFALCDRITALEYAISDQQAENLEGAIVQLVLVTSLADIIHDNENDATTDELYRMMEKMLCSILAVLERETGSRREDVGGDRYLPRALDPHLMVMPVATEARS